MLRGAKVKASKNASGTADLDQLAANLPEPALPSLDEPYAMLVTGVGGTGVVTISAVLGQAAHIEGKGFGSIDMTGLAQKGGAVACHIRVARNSEAIHAIRVGVANADLILGGDLVVTASNKILETIRPDHTAVVVSTHELITGEFTRNPKLVVPGDRLLQAIADRVRKGPFHTLDAHDYAVKLFGDSIAANMFLLGYAYQLGFVPIGAAAIEQAIELNGAAVGMNRAAFRFGRLTAHDKAAVDRVVKLQDEHAGEPETLDEIIALRARHLTDYQDEELASRYRSKVAWIAGVEKAKAPGRTGLALAVARAYHKLLAYKDEYEVARLFAVEAFQRQINEQFEGVRAMEFYLAPPILSRFFKDKTTGHPRKIRLGSWMLPVFRLLAKGKKLRGTKWDVFGHSAERKLERQMIADYERLLDVIASRLDQSNYETAVALAELPLEIRGFGHVKMANYKAAKSREADLLQAFLNPAPVKVAAE
jgi:indolepyruvate ferredoxin oxidoreductase